MRKIDTLKEKLPELELRESEPLSGHTSFRTGGAADMAFPKSASELAELLRTLIELSIPYRILGAGTNVLAPDEGVSDLVICTRDCLMGLRLLDNGKLEAMAGELLSKTAVFAREHGLSGLEFAHGIPGTVGGGIYMNAGAYGGEMKAVAVQTTVLLPDGTEKTFYADEQEFSYRTSAFENMDCVIVKAVFQLTPGNPEEIRQTMRELMAKRKASQPLEYPSAGSTFKRPTGFFAGPLIENAGLKGKGFGGAEVSEKHAGFVINKGGAASADILKTIRLVQDTVQRTSGVWLEPEVRIW